MKKKLTTLLAIVLAIFMSIPVFADPSDYPTGGTPANAPSTFTIQKKYVKLDGNGSVDLFPDETLIFTAECKAAPINVISAPKLTVEDLMVDAVTKDITVYVPEYKVPGKYNYEIKEQSPVTHTPGEKDSAGVLYDTDPVYIQVVVKYVTVKNSDGKNTSELQKFVTVTSENAGIGNGNDKNQSNAEKKADFKNKYLLDGEIDPTDPSPTPIPNPTPDPEEPDPINPIEPVNDKAKFKVMKQVRGPFASRDQRFDITVTLTSDKPVRSDIKYDSDKNTIVKAEVPESNWTKDTEGKYTAEVQLSLKDNETITFTGVPAGVSYKVQEDRKHIGELTSENVNKPAEGYTVSYYGGSKVNNPTADNTGDYGVSLYAYGTVGKNIDNNIIIANRKGLNDADKDIAKPNTGIRLDSLPYIMVLALVILGAGMMIVKSRRREE